MSDEQATVTRDVVYATVPGYRPLSLDLYFGGQPRALCVYLHGGGWRLGSRRQGPGRLAPDSARLFHRMAARGLAVASVDYRLSGEARFPAPLEDVQAACRFLADQASSLGVDALPLVTWGVSAGGHLSALRALDGDDPRVHACIAWYAPSDLEALADDVDAVGGDCDRGPGSREALLLGGPVSQLPEVARAASPVTRARKGAPPFLLVHGSGDRAVPLEQSRRLERALAAARVPVALRIVAGQDHMLPTLCDDDLNELVDSAVDFALARTAGASATS